MIECYLNVSTLAGGAFAVMRAERTKGVESVVKSVGLKMTMTG